MFKKIYIVFTCFVLISFKGTAKEELLQVISKNKNFSVFYELIQVANYQKLFNKKTQFKKVVYIPDNQAFEKLPTKIKEQIMDKEIAKKIVRTHLYSGEVKEIFKDPKKKVIILERVELSGETVKIFSNNDLFVKDMVNQDANLITDNHTIIPVKCVMFLQLSSEDIRLSLEEKNNSLITSCCLLTNNEVENFFSDQYL